MSVDATAEIIEILDDDTNVFGDPPTNHTVHDGDGPRWVGPASAAVLVALIAYGVATSASSKGVPTVAPLASTTVATTTPRPLPTTTVPATSPASPPPVPYYAADPPRDFMLQYVDMQRPRGSSPSGADHYELWASEGATANSGAWFSVDARAGGTPVYAVNAYRRQIGQLTIATSRTVDGQTITQFSPHGDSQVTISSFGWDDDSLARLAASIDMRGNSVEFTDDWFASDHRRISFVQPWLTVQGSPLEQISYVSSADPSVSVAVTVAPRPPPKQAGATLERQIALRFFVNHSTPFEVDGHSAVAGSLMGMSDVALATWIDGQSIITVGANMALPQLIAIARTVHHVSEAEWQGMTFQAARNRTDDDPNYEQSAIHPVSSGADAAAEPWTIEASIVSFGRQQHVGWSWGGGGGSTTAGDTAQINTVVDGDHTYVLADLPRTVSAAAELHVMRVGLEPVVVTFNDVDPAFDRTLAAYAFSEAVPCLAQIIGPDGGVLATWPSL